MPRQTFPLALPQVPYTGKAGHSSILSACTRIVSYPDLDLHLNVALDVRLLATDNCSIRPGWPGRIRGVRGPCKVCDFIYFERSDLYNVRLAHIACPKLGLVLHLTESCHDRDRILGSSSLPKEGAIEKFSLNHIVTILPEAKGEAQTHCTAGSPSLMKTFHFFSSAIVDNPAVHSFSSVNLAKLFSAIVRSVRYELSTRKPLGAFVNQGRTV